MDAETLLPKSFTRRRVPSGGDDLFQMAAFSLALRPTMLLLTTKLNFKVIHPQTLRYLLIYVWFNFLELVWREEGGLDSITTGLVMGYGFLFLCIGIPR